MTAKAALQRVVAGLGLLLMVPLGIQLVQGTLTPTDAAIRSVALLVGVAVSRALLISIPGKPEVIPAGEASGEDGPMAVDATVTTGRRTSDPDDAQSRAA